MNRILLIWGLLLPGILFAQTKPSAPAASAPKKLSKTRIQPVLGFQLWGTYTMGQKIYQQEEQAYQRVDDRFNLQLRRSRLGVKGQFTPRLKYNFTAALDLLGRDVLAATEAGANNGASPAFRLWNAYLQWQIKPQSQALNLVAGYFTPQMGRESMTSALRSTSMEKAWSQNYLRTHLTGIGPGRAMGLNLGGLLPAKNGTFTLGYDLGIFNPIYQSYGGNSTGSQYAPLLVGRLAAYLGQPESSTYTTGHKVNYLGKRKGLTFALAGASQGATDLFEANYAYGADFLLNLGPWNLDGDWSLMLRKGRRPSLQGSRSFTYQAQTGYLRLSYNISLHKQYVLEPLLMFVHFQGGMSESEQLDAQAVGEKAGKDQTLDAGLNLYLNPNLKLSLHYTLRQGAAGAAGPGNTLNHYFNQPKVGPIQRGDWLGLGMVAVF